MVTNQHKGRVESWKELCNEPVEDIMIPIYDAAVIEND